MVPLVLDSWIRFRLWLAAAERHREFKHHENIKIKSGLYLYLVFWWFDGEPSEPPPILGFKQLRLQDLMINAYVSLCPPRPKCFFRLCCTLEDNPHRPMAPTCACWAKMHLAWTPSHTTKAISSHQTLAPTCACWAKMHLAGTPYNNLKGHLAFWEHEPKFLLCCLELKQAYVINLQDNQNNTIQKS